MKKGINAWADYDRQGNWMLCIGKKRGKLSLDEIKQAAQEYELSASLDALEEQLGSRFVRTHRSYLVNQRHILSYDAGTMTVTLDDESVVYLSRTGKARLKEALAW